MTSSLPIADRAGIRALVRQLKAKEYARGAIAVAARPEWSGDPTLTLDGQRVRVRTAPSVLAIRDALLDRYEVDWVVILTDRPATEIPVGVQEHLTGRHTLSHLDPWPALREAFNATSQEYSLLGNKNDAARSALRSLPDAVQPAPGGVLTGDHLFGALTRGFGLEADSVAPHRVALWSISSTHVRFESWRESADPVLLEQFNAWLSRRLGDAGRAMTAVWRTRGPADLVPLGLVAALTDDTHTEHSAATARDTVVVVRTLLAQALGVELTEREIRAWGTAATLAAQESGTAPVLRRATDLVSEFRATPLVGRSDVLPDALPHRLAHFAVALDSAVEGGPLADAEDSWEAVRAHSSALADGPDAPQDVRVARSALRLLRWTRGEFESPVGLSAWLLAYRTELSWVDAAIDEAFVGAEDPALQSANGRILETVRARRGAYDREFARELAASATHAPSDDAFLPIENLLDRVVVPLTQPAPSTFGDDRQDRSPVLLIVADGMGSAAANEIVTDLTRRSPQWQQFTRDDLPTSAVAVLPTVTRFSRCSLLTGALTAGDQTKEKPGFASWLERNGLPAEQTPLFHKAQLDTLAGGSLAPEVRESINDTVGTPVVACVLNTIDDALDKSDPIGTVWTVSQVRHLEALLAAAATVGRTVVLVSDHGHVVERSEAPSVQRGTRTSARHRPVDEPAEAYEVLLTGPRVLADGSQEILAVDEQVRYTGKKAGYHGGGSPAEVTIPVTILVKGAPPAHLELRPGGIEAPQFWNGSPASIIGPVPMAAPKAPTKPARRKAEPKGDGLFDLPDAPSTSPSAPVQDSAVAALEESDLFRSQMRLFAPRMKAAAVGSVIREAISLGGVLPLARVDALLGSTSARVGRTAPTLLQVFNVDGVEAVSVNGTELVVAADVLFEQFGVRR
ncbi:BREX-2 system phosphatase PglZ [Tsukamurella sp. M9C]|uniref:BREX-2 system phosphatase PglZ n=1 Tax=Tsukamurella sp. M9C TaxID=2877520 RepID=UPI001CCA207A|nr:BREX-2 system phosphatase PglZ [Tsukamurella sp. M9C]MCA0156406.1 BREX-2 system phosphatase PglZ [Tsukamurella sp. M9C]